ncbi:protein Wnt-5 [Musca domestica]|uniref:Protein Wnt n=1 Tax=Musca domestica TaxID=7370 RepID=A0A1I8M7F0_MUSDO|nr:protein Wnt-5 [Musca domestica]XP_019892374.1 protein Wnt-5 [Musca domestica]
MEFLKRKHFSLWITTTFIIIVAGITTNVSPVQGLQGVPTWISLGIKSPFIEFRNEFEVLANNSIALNITKDEQALMHQEGLRKLGTFIKPVDLRDSETGFVKANLTKKIATPMPQQRTQTQRRMHPIQEEMDQKQIILLDEDTDENGLPASLTDEDRKFIVPMALKNSQPDPRWAQSMARSSMLSAPTAKPSTTTTTKKPTTPATPEFASNIEDLKKHILFLQNLTKHDSNFQSKFVVFPSLQKDKQGRPITTTSTTTTTASPKVPFRPIYQYSAPVLPPTRKSSININSKISHSPPFGGYYHNDDDEESLSAFLQPVNNNGKDKIAIVPQVLLLNDQNKDRRMPVATTTTSTTTTTTSTTTTTTTTTTTRRPTKPTKLPPCVRNPEAPKCIRLRKREELQRQRDREQLLREQEKYWPRYEPYRQTINNTKRFAVSIEIPDSIKAYLNETKNAKNLDGSGGIAEENLQILSRFVRSTHKRRNIGGGLQGRSTASNDKFASKYGTGAFLDRDSVASSTGGRDFVIPNAEQMGMMAANATTPSPTVPPYSEPLDLNPDNCYLVDGMSYGQKKQCVLHTSVMPAISRGARATIQECQFQFKNRRWNCTTTEDNTVFGPMTGLGSPEMAFIHALAAATVTSFIARACRDGQLASCGCSSGSRPKQLHDDWNWGGCGDNLEYAYKFATDFIDIREKETRRGTRGVGNPEKRNGGGGGGRGQRMHQRRQQQLLQQQLKQQQQMLADDASVSITTSVKNDTKATITKQQQQQQQQQQHLANNKAQTTNGSNRTAEEATQSLSTSQSSGASVSSSGSSSSSSSSDLKSLENTNKNVNNSSNNSNPIQHSNGTDVNTSTTQVSSSLASSSSSRNISPGTSSMTSSSNNAAAAADSSNYQSQNQRQTNRQRQQMRSTTTSTTAPPSSSRQQQQDVSASSEEETPNGGGGGGLRIKPEDLLELQERITKEILNSKLQEKEMLELQEKINREILNSKVFNMDVATNGGGSSSFSANGNSNNNNNNNNNGGGGKRKRKRKNQRAVNGMLVDVGEGGPYANSNSNGPIGTSGGSNGGGGGGGGSSGKWKNSIAAKARSLMNLHNNEAGRRAVIKKTRITCKCHGVSGSCSLITCWQQLSSIREIGDYLREKYEESTEVKLNKRGRLQVKDPQFKVPTAHDLVYLDESPDWCRSNKQLQWPGTHGRVCNKTSNGLDGCGILCCGRGYNTKNIVVRERCNCKFHWCCQVKCDVCVKVIEEHTCK